MFSLEPQVVVQVRYEPMPKDPITVCVTKIIDANFVDVRPRNTALHNIIKKGIDDPCCKPWSKKLLNTNILDQLKRLKDEEYQAALSQGPPSKRARAFKAFVLQLPDTCTIKAPDVGEVAGFEMRVVMSDLDFVKCKRPLFNHWFMLWHGLASFKILASHHTNLTC